MPEQEGMVFIHCPNGHTFRTAVGRLQERLSCPVCSAIFVAEAHGTPAASNEATVMDYGDRFTLPAKPRYVGTLIAGWLIAGAAGVVVPLLAQRVSGLPIVMVGPTLWGIIGLVALAILLASIVLQLVWIYRIHADAEWAGGYKRVSPGLALGLSFIPLFNYFWTAWVMTKLAQFAREPRSDERPGKPAQDAGRIASLLAWAVVALTASILCTATVTIPRDQLHIPIFVPASPPPRLSCHPVILLAMVMALSAMALYCLAVHRLTDVLSRRLAPSPPQAG